MPRNSTEALVYQSVHAGVAVLLWLAFAVKVRDLSRDRRNTALGWLCLFILGTAVSLSVGHEQVYAVVDRITGVPNVAKLIQQLSVVGALYAAAAMSSRLTRNDAQPVHRLRRWGRPLLFGAVTAAMTVLFILAPVDVSEPVFFGDRYSTAPFIPAYTLVYLGFMAYCTVLLGRSALRYARRAHTAYLRIGMRLLVGAAGFAVAWVAFKAGYLVLRVTGHQFPVREGIGSTPLVLAAFTLGVIGLALPRVGPGVVRLRRLPARVRAYRDLSVLWRDLCQAWPDIVLERSGRWPAFHIARLDYHLYRRVIEVRDGLLALQPYLDPAVVTRARNLAADAGLHGDDALVIGEAAAIRDALDARARDAPAPTQPGYAFRDAGENIDEEITWLTRVARAYQRSPLIAAAVAAGPGLATEVPSTVER